MIQYHCKEINSGILKCDASLAFCNKEKVSIPIAICIKSSKTNIDLADGSIFAYSDYQKKKGGSP